jgi:hypothetical protein
MINKIHVKMKANNSMIKNKVFDCLRNKYLSCIAEKPKVCYTISGLQVFHPNTRKELIFDIISANTWRGFHRINSANIGAKQIVSDFFLSAQSLIVKDLYKVKDRATLDCLSDKIADELFKLLSKNIKGEQLKKYNKIRKCVDIYFEHWVLLSCDIPADVRQRLLPLLFVPLDSYKLKFLKSLDPSINLPSNPSMFSINNKSTYSIIQFALQNICSKNNLIAPVALDLIWRERYSMAGEDFFEITINAIKNK